MAAITAALIKQVREETGAGMMDVKKALTEAEGDVARAKEIIRAKGIQAAGKREGRKAQEGTIASQVVESANGQTGYAVELNSETDFVAKTPKFVEFADSVLEDAVKAEAASVDEVLAAASGEATVKEAVEEAAALFGEHVKVGQFAKVEGPHVADPRGRSGRCGRVRAPRGHREVLGRRQAGEDRSEDRGRPSQCLLQGERPARAVLCQGSVQDRWRPVQGSRRRSRGFRSCRGRQGRG